MSVELGSPNLTLKGSTTKFPSPWKQSNSKSTPTNNNTQKMQEGVKIVISIEGDKSKQLPISILKRLTIEIPNLVNLSDLIVSSSISSLEWLNSNAVSDKRVLFIANAKKQGECGFHPVQFTKSNVLSSSIMDGLKMDGFCKRGNVEYQTCSNPSLQAFTESHRLWKEPNDRIIIISIGSGRITNNNNNDCKNSNSNNNNVSSLFNVIVNNSDNNSSSSDSAYLKHKELKNIIENMNYDSDRSSSSGSESEDTDNNNVDQDSKSIYYVRFDPVIQSEDEESITNYIMSNKFQRKVNAIKSKIFQDEEQQQDTNQQSLQLSHQPNQQSLSLLSLVLLFFFNFISMFGRLK